MRTAIFAALLSLLYANGALAADDPAIPVAVYPALTKHAAAIDGFVPPGWRIETQLAGDLNADGLADAVLVLRDNNPNNLLDVGRSNGQRLDTNPRILAVAFASAKGGYDLALENHSLIARTTDPFQQDPLDPNGIQEGGVAIKNGAVQVMLGYFGGNMGRITYTFRFQNGGFRLIGYARVDVERNSGVITDVSINYSTRRMVRKLGNIADDRENVTRKALPAKPLLSPEQVGDGLEFQPH